MVQTLGWAGSSTPGEVVLWGTRDYSWVGREPYEGDRLFDPYNPLNEEVVTVVSWQEMAYDATGDVVQVYGRADPVVVTDIKPYPSGTFKLATLDEAERQWLGSLLATGRIIGFKPGAPEYGFPDPTYLYVGKVTQTRVVNRVTALERHWTLEVQVVEAPVVT